MLCRCGLCEWAKKVRARLTDITIQESLRVAARDILPEISTRVFEEGKNPKLGDIGEYSTKPIYISKKATPKIAGGIDKPKTIFYPGGYKEFKTDIGRGPKVNLRLFGRLQQAFLAMGERLSGQQIVLYLKDADQVAKKDGLVSNDKYGDVFKFSFEEYERTQRTFTFELEKRLFAE